MLSGNCTEALSIQANVTISCSSAKLIKNGTAPLPFPTGIELRKESALLCVQSKYNRYLQWECRQLLKAFPLMLLVLSKRCAATSATEISVHAIACGPKISPVNGN